MRVSLPQLHPMAFHDLDAPAPCTLVGDGSPAFSREPERDAWRRRFLVISRAYLCALEPAPLVPAPAELRRGPSSAVLRKRLRLVRSVASR